MREPDAADSDELGDHDHDDDDGGFITYNVVHEPSGLHAHSPSSPIPEENHIGVNNPAYYPDDERANNANDDSNSRSEITDDEEGDRTEKDQEDRFDESNEVTLPSPTKRSSKSSNSSKWSSPRRKLSAASTGRERRDRAPSVTPVGASASEPTSPEPRDSSDRWELPVTGGSPRGLFHSPQHRRVSDVSPRRLPTNRPMKNNARSRSQDYQTWDYFQRNLRLKVCSVCVCVCVCVLSLIHI